MNPNVILYDKIWLSQYVDRLEYQRNLVRTVEYKLQRASQKALPEVQVICADILLNIGELNESLKITELTLKEYLNNVHNTAAKLQKQCQEIQLPEFYMTDYLKQ